MLEALTGVRYLLIDLDGCMYRGEQLTEGAKEAIELLKKRGINYLYLTNNSTKSPREFAEKLSRLGVLAKAEEIFTSAQATVLYMERLERKPIYVVGSSYLKQQLLERGFSLVEEDRAELAGYVVVGLDFQLTYQKLAAACLAIQRGAKFIATNPDPNLPLEDHYLPGAGSIVSAIAVATGVKPLVIGKPSKIIVNLALKKLRARKRESAIVGDRLDTDIRAGKAAGIKTILLSHGAILPSLEKTRVKPDFVVNSLLSLAERLGGGSP